MNVTTARQLEAAGTIVAALDEPALIIGTQHFDDQLWVHVMYLDDLTPNQWLPATQVREH